MKIIALLRNPAERTIADLTFRELFLVRRGSKKLQSNEIYANKFKDILVNSTTGKVNSEDVVIRTSQYARQLTEWLKYFNRSQVMLIDSEKFKDDPVPILQEVEDFLEVQPALTEEMFTYNKEKGFYCYIVEGDTVCMSPIKGAKHPEMDPKVMKKLKDYFKPWNEKLFKLVNTTFNWL